MGHYTLFDHIVAWCAVSLTPVPLTVLIGSLRGWF